MKRLEIEQMEVVSGEGYAASFCATVTGLAAVSASFPTVGAAVAASGPWGMIAVLGSVTYCAGYLAGKW